jgi:hypothetical protein
LLGIETGGVAMVVRAVRHGWPIDARPSG